MITKKVGRPRKYMKINGKEYSMSVAILTEGIKLVKDTCETTIFAGENIEGEIL